MFDNIQTQQPQNCNQPLASAWLSLADMIIAMQYITSAVLHHCVSSTSATVQ
jgi:hypothetical protein